MHSPAACSGGGGLAKPTAVGYSIRNRERTSRMLMLMQLHANDHDRELDYTRRIREWLEGNSGRPSVKRRRIADPRCLTGFR